MAAAAVAATVAIIVITGLLTDRFGLARPRLTPGTYILSGPSGPGTTVLSVSEGDRVSLSVGGFSIGGGDARVSQARRDHLHVQMQVHIPMAVEIGAPSDLSYNLVIPQGVPDSITGTWATWTTDENGLPWGVTLPLCG